MAASEGRGSLKTKHAAICDGKEEMLRAWVNTVLRVMGQWITKVFLRRSCVPWCWYFPPLIYVSRWALTKFASYVATRGKEWRNVWRRYWPPLFSCPMDVKGLFGTTFSCFCCNCHGNCIRGVTEARCCTLSYRKISQITYTLLCRGLGVIH